MQYFKEFVFHVVILHEISKRLIPQWIWYVDVYIEHGLVLDCMPSKSHRFNARKWLKMLFFLLDKRHEIVSCVR